MSIVKETAREQPLLFAGILIGLVCTILGLLFEWAEILFFVAIMVCGIPIIWGAISSVIEDRDITADVLVSIAIIAANLIGEYEAAAEISVIMQIGSLLEEATVNRANSQMMKLSSLAPEMARLISDRRAEMVPIEKIGIDDVIRIAPGEPIPVDGMVISGNTSIDMSMLTGESIPVDVSEGDNVSSGTMNLYGSIDVRVDRIGKDATAARMARMLELARANKSRIVRTADKWAAYIVVIALSVAVLTLALTGDPYRAVTVLVVFCPCALILATPTAIMAAAGNLSKKGILVKNGNALENLARTDVILMDKTGTLTTGSMECIGFESTSAIEPGELSDLVSSLEALSEHPLGKAIASVGEHYEVKDFAYKPGMGVEGTVGGRRIYAGNPRFMKEACPEGLEAALSSGSARENDGFTVVYAGIDGVTAGFAMISDTVKEGSGKAIRNLQDMGLQTIMLTGDSESVARRVSSELGMDDVVWECLPEDKFRTIDLVRKEHPTCMVGDGLNDAPSLKLADVGISMGAMGSGLAKDSADIVFLDDDIGKIDGLIRMSRRTLLTIKVGIAFSLILNSSAMIMAVFGLMGPVAGALIHNIGSVIVITAAAMLLGYDCWSEPMHIESPSRLTS